MSLAETKSDRWQVGKPIKTAIVTLADIMVASRMSIEEAEEELKKREFNADERHEILVGVAQEFNVRLIAYNSKQNRFHRPPSMNTAESKRERDFDEFKDAIRAEEQRNEQIMHDRSQRRARLANSAYTRPKEKNELSEMLQSRMALRLRKDKYK